MNTPSQIGETIVKALGFPRAPLAVPQADENGCETAVAAQAAYVFGRVQYPQPDTTDRMVGRATGQRTYSTDVQQWWLTLGLALHIYARFDDGEFLRRGVGYLRETYGDAWSRDHEVHFGPEKIDELSQRALMNAARRAPYLQSGLLTITVVSRMDVAAIQTLLSERYALDITLRPHGRQTDLIQAAGLVVPTSPSAAWLYSPTQPPLVSQLSVERLVRLINLDRPVVAIRG